MTSACILKDKLKNDTQMILKLKVSIFEICLPPINFSSTPYFLTSSTLSRNAGTSKETPPNEKRIFITRNTNHFLKSISFTELLREENIFFIFLYLKFKYGLQYLNDFNRFRYIFRGATLERAKPATKQLP